MPNWCYNHLNVYGKLDFLSDFRDFFYKKSAESAEGTFEGGLFEAFSPIDGVNDTNWYERHLTHWGTKWDVRLEELDVNDYDDSLHLKFHTAWSPPIPFVSTLSLLYPNLHFALHFREDGMCFGGTSIAYRGVSVVSKVDFSDISYPDDCAPGDDAWDDVTEQINLKLEGAEIEAEAQFLKEMLFHGEKFGYEDD